MTMFKDMNELNWVEVCALDDITPNTGVAALVEDQQIAIFRVGSEKRVYALSNQDPFSKAFVMSRGIIGDFKASVLSLHQFTSSISVWRLAAVWKIKTKSYWFSKQD